MTKVVFKKNGTHFKSLKITGHVNFNENGFDVVCAGLSFISQTAVLGIKEIVRVKAKYKIDELKGSLFLELPDGLSEEELHDCDIILQTAYLGIADLKQGYSKFIQLEVI